MSKAKKINVGDKVSFKPSRNLQMGNKTLVGEVKRVFLGLDGNKYVKIKWHDKYFTKQYTSVELR